MKFLILLLSLIQFALAGGGNEVGNGGTVLFSIPAQKAYLFYDHFESIERYHLHPRWPESRARDELKIAELFLRRLQRIDPRVYRILSSWVESFYLDTRWTYNELPMINDTGMIFIPHGSELRQMIIQKKGKYTINKKLWNDLPNSEKSIAVLHEVIYRYQLQLQPTLFSSRTTRYLVALIISGEIEKFSKDELREIFLQD